MHLLEMAGVDLTAPTIDVALRSARPVQLTPGSLAVASEEERAIHEHENQVFSRCEPRALGSPATAHTT